MKYKKILVISLIIPFAIGMKSLAKEKIESKEGTNVVLSAKLYGVIKDFSLKLPSTWVIKNKKVLVNSKTIIEEKYAKIAKGAYVEVKGYYLGKDFIAKKIEVRRTRDDDDDKNSKNKSDKNSKSSK